MPPDILLATSIDEDSVDLCDVVINTQSPEPTVETIRVQRLYNTVQLPKPSSGNRASFLLHAPVDFELQPGEWKGMFFGLRFDADNELKGQLEPLVPLEVRNGLSMQGDAVSLTSPSEFALVLENKTNSVFAVPADLPMVRVTVDRHQQLSSTTLMATHLWSCPKCKHGGKEREHSRYEGGGKH